MRNYYSILISVAVAISATNHATAQFKVEPDKDNIVASCLAGDWKCMPELNKKIGPHPDAPDGRVPGIRFQNDPLIVTTLPANPWLQKTKIYMAGHMTWAGRTIPFVLVTKRGNPTIIYFLPKRGQPKTLDPEDMTVMLVKAKKSQNDLMFLREGQGVFTAFQRVDTEKAKPGP